MDNSNQSGSNSNRPAGGRLPPTNIVAGYSGALGVGEGEFQAFEPPTTVQGMAYGSPPETDKDRIKRLENELKDLEKLKKENKDLKEKLKKCKCGKEK